MISALKLRTEKDTNYLPSKRHLNFRDRFTFVEATTPLVHFGIQNKISQQRFCRNSFHN
jgi:hypothetical protein